MPMTEVADGEGHSMRVFEFQGKGFPPASFMGNMDDILTRLPDLAARDDDVMLLAYPKAGTHWVWEAANMLVSGSESGDNTRHKEESMIEIMPQEGIDKLPSVRLLNSHVTPDIYPIDLVKKKIKIVYILRNPKDIFVSYFHHVNKIKLYEYENGTWNGFYNVIMDGKNDYGSWFEFTTSWDKFFKEHTDIPVLTLHYEDLKKDLSAGVKKIAEFLNVPCDKAILEKVVDKCSFDTMKKDRGVLPDAMKVMAKDGLNPMFRKGIVGDWKNHFTVAQNERFDSEYKQKMAGHSFYFEQYI